MHLFGLIVLIYCLIKRKSEKTLSGKSDKNIVWTELKSFSGKEKVVSVDVLSHWVCKWKLWKERNIYIYLKKNTFGSVIALPSYV